MVEQTATSGRPGRLQVTVRKATAADVPRLVDTMARAFDDDPIANWFAAQDERRSARIHEFMQVATEKLTFPHDEVYTSDGIEGGALWNPPGTWKMGFLSDGCSGEKSKASHTEVGAKLLVRRALVETRTLLVAGVALDRLNAPLYAGCIQYLRALANLTYVGLGDEGEFLDFVGNTLMCTLLGFVTDGERIVTLRSGDGVQIVNDTVSIIHDDCPLYMGYHILTGGQLAHVMRRAGRQFVLPQEFAAEVHPAEAVTRLALCSDGILRREEGRELVHPDDLAGIFGYQPDAPAGLQWHLNKRHQVVPFDDDCAVVTATRESIGTKGA